MVPNFLTFNFQQITSLGLISRNPFYSVGLALIGTVLGEFFAGSTAGLGHEIRLMQTKSSVRLWAATYVLAAVGVVAVVAIGIIERLALHWHDSQQKRSD